MIFTDCKKGPPYPPYATKLAWLIGLFLKDIGHVRATEEILTSLNNKLQKVRRCTLELFLMIQPVNYKSVNNSFVCEM